MNRFNFVKSILPYHKSNINKKRIFISLKSIYVFCDYSHIFMFYFVETSIDKPIFYSYIFILDK